MGLTGATTQASRRPLHGSVRYNDHIYSLRYNTRREHVFGRLRALLDLEPATATSFGDRATGLPTRDHRGTDRDTEVSATSTSLK